MRVFISSVMTGFEEHREAATVAVESLGHEPVLAERFPSQPRSSKSACLTGVESSDVYIGLLGARYGFVTPDGVSVTEEEFEAAHKRGLPILLFVQNVEKEPQQEAFIRRAGDYDEGYFFGKFSNTTQLVATITKALTNLQREQTVAHPDGPAKQLRALLGLERDHDNRVWLEVAIVPLDQREFIPPERLGNHAFRESVLQPALFGTSALFSWERGSTLDDGQEYLRLSQPDGRDRQSAMIEIHTDGSVLLTSVIHGPPARSMMDRMFDDFVIDVAEVTDRMERSLRYAGTMYGHVLSSGPSRAIGQAMLCNCSNKKFGVRPKQPLMAWTMSLGGMAPTITVPSKPISLSRAELVAPATVTGKLITLFERAFRESGAHLDQTVTHR